MDLMHVLQVALHFDQHLSGLIVQYGTAVYAMLFLVVFVEIGFLPLFFLPGDPLAAGIPEDTLQRRSGCIRPVRVAFALDRKVDDTKRGPGPGVDGGLSV